LRLLSKTLMVLCTHILLSHPWSAHAALGDINTIAGGGNGGDGGAATSASVYPFGVAVDDNGNIYIAEYGMTHRVRKVTVATGIITTMAGNGSAGYSGDGGPASSAILNTPAGVALDRTGNLYIADQANNRIRKVTAATGVITTIAGNGIQGFSGDGGQATAASIDYPSAIAVDTAGNIYIADSGNYRIRKVAAGTGIITTVAGNGTFGFSGDGGVAILAGFSGLMGVAVDSSGNLYISEMYFSGVTGTPISHIRKVTAATGIINTVAGNGTAGYSGDGGPATAASFGATYGVTVDSNGNLFITDPDNNRIRMVAAGTGIITTVAGNGTLGFSGDGGPATAASLNGPTGVIIDSVGNLYIADYINGRVRKVILHVGPVAVTGTASSITANGATLNGTVNDNGADTTVSFEYGLTTGYGSSVSGGTVAAGSGNTPVSVAITGLACNSTYHFRVDALNSAGPVSGSDQTFTTAGCVPTTTPAAVTGSASAITATGATLNGTVIDHNGNTTVTFEYGLTAAYGNSVSGGMVTSGSGNTPVEAAINGLTCNTSYHFRVDAVNSAGSANGSDQTFTTASCGTLATMQRGIVTTAGGWIGDGGTATSAGLAKPFGVAVDSAGNQFIADTYNNRIRKVAAGSGIITTVAGSGNGGFAGDGEAATSAMLFSPSGVALDSSGNLYIADQGNNRIRKVAVGTGIITTVAGNGTAGFAGDDNAATLATLNYPSGVVVDSTGNLFIVDSPRIRKVAAGTGIITTVAGNGTTDFSGDGGMATSAGLYPAGVAVDNNSNLYIADYWNNRIRKVMAETGIITTVAGGGTGGLGDGGAATAASLWYPNGVALDNVGNLYIADSQNQRIRKVAAGTNIITTFAGNGTLGFSGDGGTATSANIYKPSGLAVDSFGNLYIADTNNSRIRKVASGSNIITTVAGGYLGDNGKATSAGLYGPHGVSVDNSGNLYIADRYGNRIRKVANGTGVITTVAGTGSSGFSGDGAFATNANINNPWRAVADSSGNLYIADSGNNRIRKVETGTGIITTVAGNGNSGFSGDDGLATSANLGGPTGVAVDTAGNIYVASSNRIRKVDVGTGIITTVAGNGTTGFSGDGGAATSASLNSTSDVAVDNAGNIYIADRNNYRIRKVAVGTGIITTVAGNGSGGFSGDNGTATSAGFFPWGLAVDGNGNLYIADPSSSRIRLVVAENGIITTVAGNGVGGFSGDGGSATSATLAAPMGVAVDSIGNLYIADYINNRIRRVSAALKTLTVASSNPANGINITVSPVDINSNSGGPTPLARSYAQDANVTLTAPATSGGNYFSGWTGCDNTSGQTCKVSMSADKTVTASFVTSIYKSLNVSITGTGSGSVNSIPSGPIACSYSPLAGNCSTSQPADTTLTLAASPSGDSTFNGWSGACTNSISNCDVLMNSDKILTATFSLAPLARILTAPYNTLQLAYNAAANSGSVIMLKEGDPGSALGTFNANLDKSVTLRGGYNATYQTNSGSSVILGPVTIDTGTVIIDNVGVR
jgi:hypothetical protein